jgi:3-hydroxybutyryl-CoA dehydratase
VTDEVLGVRVGTVVTFTKQITARDVELFAEASGDDQPLHLNDAVAAKTRFKQRIAHGILTAGVISAAIGTRLVPNGIAIYMGQTLQFLKPVLLGDTVTARLEVKALDVERRRATLLTECTNQNGEKVLTGEATVMLDRYQEG